MTTDAAAMAAALQEHWRRTFSTQPVDDALLTQWLATLPQLRPDKTSTSGDRENAPNQRTSQPGDTTRQRANYSSSVSQPTTPTTTRSCRKPLPKGERNWRIRRRDIENAIQESGDTAPGPDGILYEAWRQLGTLAVTTLWQVATLLESPDASHQLSEAYTDELTEDLHHSYNLGNLVCLAKKPAGRDELAGEDYTPADTRPLSIVNCDNRLVANAARLRWEEHFQQWVLDRQQGFLPGRSIVANLLDLDTNCIETALQHPDGACILFDFKAAFPSVSQEYIRRVLADIGLPTCALTLIDSLHDHNSCKLSFQGGEYSGFEMGAGERQGCPLSPLLCAIIAEVLLDKIEKECPETMARAYADDTAIVTNNFQRDAPTLQQIFSEFGRISGLHLNTSKSVIIPLSVEHLDKFRARLAVDVPDWSNMVVARSGTYLGFSVGPEKQDQSWTKPAAKFKTRVAMWSNEPLGLHYATLVYNVFAMTTLGYICQLENPPEWLVASTGGNRT